MRKILSIVLSCLMLLAFLAGCNTKNEETEQTTKETTTAATSEKEKDMPDYLNAEGFPIANKMLKMSMVTVKPANGGAAEDLWFFKWARERANLDFEVKQIDGQAWGQQKNIMFSSGDIPDVFYNCNLRPDDLVRFGMVEGHLLELEPYIKDYAPNIAKIFAENNNLRATVITPDGKMYTLPSILGEENGARNSTRAWINQAWLNNVGMKTPDTIDDFYNVLKAFKEKDANGNGDPNDEIPLGGTWSELYAENDIILSAFGMPVMQYGNANPVSTGLYFKGGQLKLHVLQPEYKDYLMFMNKLWSEGLMDKDFFTQTTVQARAKSTENLYGVTCDGAPHLINSAKYTDWVSITPMTSSVNSQKMWPSAPVTNIGQFAVSKNSKYPEALIRLADYAFTPKGSIDLWYGPMQGSQDLVDQKGWFVKDGVITYDYTEKGNNTWNYMNAYINPINGNMFGLPPTNDNIKAVYNTGDLKTDPLSLYWWTSVDKNIAPYLVQSVPNILYFDEKSLQRKNELITALDDYVAQMTAKFVVGDESFSNYDNFVNQVKGLGAEEYVSIMQDVCDNYLANLK